MKTREPGPSRLLNRVRDLLPEGGSLPDDVWQQRHRGILVLLWLHVIGIACFGVFMGYGIAHSLAEAAVVAGTAVLANWQRVARRFRAASASAGLLISSSILVHLSGGHIEAHFHFFVMVPIIALYQDWIPFSLAIGYVLIHHGTVGVLDPTSVYNPPMPGHSPGSGRQFTPRLCWVSASRASSTGGSARLHRPAPS